MFLADLQTQNEKEAFLGLAYLIARADGNIGYSEHSLFDLYYEELGLKKTDFSVATKPLINLCRTFSDRQTRQIVYTNLLPIAFVDGYDNEGLRALMEVIQNEFSITPQDARRYEDEIRVLQGRYFPDYAD